MKGRAGEQAPRGSPAPQPLLGFLGGSWGEAQLGSMALLLLCLQGSTLQLPGHHAQHIATAAGLLVKPEGSWGSCMTAQDD